MTKLCCYVPGLGFVSFLALFDPIEIIEPRLGLNLLNLDLELETALKAYAQTYWETYGIQHARVKLWS